MRAQLHQPVQDLRSIFNTLTDSITIHDKDFNIIYANNAAMKMLRLPSLENTKTKCYKYYHGNKRPPKTCPSCQCVKTGKPAVSELFEPFLKRAVEIRAIPRFDNDVIAGVIHIVRDITRRKKAEDHLKRTLKELQCLSAHLQSVREEERKHIAREIHDELAQTLTALSIDMKLLSRNLSAGQSALKVKAEDMSQLIDTALTNVHRISTALRPVILDNLGLPAALQWQADEFQKRTGIACNMKVSSECFPSDQDRSVTLFRIFQESLTNVVRHANATRVNMHLRINSGNLLMEIRDNGHGITREQIADPKSFGLIGMRERVRFFGGTLKITGIKGSGTTVSVSIPADGFGE